MKSLKKYSTVLIVILIALLVTGIGALAGWLLVLHSNGQTISFESAMRGLGFGGPSAGQNGSNYNNIGEGGGGQGSFSSGSTYGNGGAGGGNSDAGAYGGGSMGGGVSTDGNGSSAASSSISLSYGSSTLPTVVVPKTPRLWHISRTPIAGFSFATSGPIVFFAERATGYLFTADAISGDILRRTNTLFPKTYEARIAHDGAVLYRSINETTGSIQTFSGIMGSSTSANLGSLLGVNLPNNIFAMDANPDTKTIFFMVTADDGTFSGITEPWIAGKSGKQKQIFTSPIASWKPIALSDGRLLILEKSQDDAPGYAYEIAADGSLKPIVRAAPGLTFLPLANSSAYVFGTSANGTLSLFAQTATTTFALPVKTIADKCVWAPYLPATKKRAASDLVVYCAVPATIDTKDFLESWYMGDLHTSDSWWRMDLTTGKTDQISSGDTSGVSLDVIDPSIDPTGNFLGFKNNVDDSLWVLRISK